MPRNRHRIPKGCTPADAQAKEGDTAPVDRSKQAANAVHSASPDDDAWGLLRLPPDAFELVWRALDSSRDQFALRASCRGAKQATTPLIKVLAINADTSSHDDAAGWEDRATEEALRVARRSLSQFPSDAVLTELRWVLNKAEVAYMVIPGLLPTLFLEQCQSKRRGNKLAALEKLSLQGNAALSIGDTFSVATACPKLSTLHLVDVPLIGPVFFALTKLKSFTSLTLNSVRLPQGVEGFASSLASLQHLTCFKALDMVQHDPCWDEASLDSDYYDEYSDYDDSDSEESIVRREAMRQLERSRLRAESVLPHIAHMRNLRSLHLQLEWRADSISTKFKQLTQLKSLSQLTSLTFGNGPMHEMDEMGCEVDNFVRADGTQLAPLGRMTALVSLHLPDMGLDTTAISLVLGLQRLTQLEVGRLSPDKDLSGMPCTWRKLLVEFGLPTLRQLLMLPLGNVTDLQVGDLDCCSIDWELTANDIPGAAAQVCKASQLLARAWIEQLDQACNIRLCWDRQPTAPTHQVVASLAPLSNMQHPARLALGMTTRWELDQGLARALAHALPCLYRLKLSAGSPGFVEFVDALGCHPIKALRHLHIVDVTPLPASELLALQRLAMAHVDAALPLLIHCPDCTNSKERKHSNNQLMPRCRAKGMAKDAVKFMGSGYLPDRYIMAPV